ELIHQLYRIRSCRLPLNEKSIREGKFAVCLEYHIGNCKAPCVGKQSETEYNLMIQDVREILRGRTASLVRLLKARMTGHAEKYEFEQAHEIKERISQLEQYRAKSVIITGENEDLDVFTYSEDGNMFYVNYLQVVEGAVVQGHTLELRRKMDESPGELLTLAIFDLRRRFRSTAKDILVEEIPEVQIPGLKYHKPQRGDTRMLVDLSKKNLKFYIQEQLSRLAVRDPEEHTRQVLELMQKDLRLPVLPKHIEC